MTAADAYYKRAKDAIRRHENDPEAAADAIRDVLFVFLKELPENLKHDIFNFYFDKYLDAPEPKNLYQLAESPVNMLDFVTGQVPSSEAEFSDEEWDMIKEGINANAEDMDLRLLNQLMSVLVDKKKY